MSLKHQKKTCLVLIALTLGACSAMTPESIKGWKNRYGPDAAISTESLQQSIKDQDMIMSALEEQARDSKGNIDYRNVALAGFNFIDEQCDAYLRELYVIDIERNRLKSGIADTGLMTNAVMTATNASKISMSVVTSAFGLSGQFTDSFADSYLYGKHASTVLTVVQKLQTAERDNLGKAPPKLYSRPEAYAWIRSYLKLCMPPMIEAQIENTLTSSTAGRPTDTNGNPVKGLGSDQTVTLQAPSSQ